MRNPYSPPEDDTELVSSRAAESTYFRVFGPAYLTFFALTTAVATARGFYFQLFDAVFVWIVWAVPYFFIAVRRRRTDGNRYRWSRSFFVAIGDGAAAIVAFAATFTASQSISALDQLDAWSGILVIGLFSLIYAAIHRWVLRRTGPILLFLVVLQVPFEVIWQTWPTGVTEIVDGTAPISGCMIGAYFPFVTSTAWWFSGLKTELHGEQTAQN